MTWFLIKQEIRLHNVVLD